MRRMRRSSRLVGFLLSLLLILHSGIARSAEDTRPVGFYIDLSVVNKPSVHEIGERIRISEGIDSDQMMRFPGMRESMAASGSEDLDWDELQRDACNMLRAEIRMVYAELSSVRRQTEEIRQCRDVIRMVAEITAGQYAIGKMTQADVLRAQTEWAKATEVILLLGKREKLLAIRLNVLAGLPLDRPVPALEGLKEVSVAYDREELLAAYKSRRFLKSAEQVFRALAAPSADIDMHGIDSVELEGKVYLSNMFIVMETLSSQINLYRTTCIPRANQALDVRIEAYKAGKADFPAVMDCIRDVLGMRKEYHAMLGDIHVMKARLESAIGKALD